MGFSFSKLLVAFIFVCSSLSIAAAKEKTLDSVKVGVSPVTSTAGIFIALEKGFFKNENLNVDLQVFSASSAPMIPLIAKGELDVGGGNITAGLFAASNSNVDLKIVADKGSVREGADYIHLLVRKELITSGKFKSPKDLKGLKVSFTALDGTSQEAALAKILKPHSLTIKDLQTIKLSYSDANKALANGSIDATIQIEPFVTQALKAGTAESITGVFAAHPNQQSAVLFYSPKFASERKDVGIRFMKAYIEGCRYYSSAFKKDADPKLLEETIQILKKWTGIEDESLLKSMIPVGLDPNGQVNLAGLKEDVSYFLSQGYIKTEPKWENIVDTSFTDAAAKLLDSPKKKPSSKKAKK